MRSDPASGGTYPIFDHVVVDRSGGAAAELDTCTKQQQNAGQCTFVISTGILLFGVDQKLVDTSNNTFRNNDANLVNLSNH